jgi:predicted  nucleic acid-binding Zn-ribbon protein
MLPMLEEDIADLVLDIDPIRRIFLAIKDNLTSSLAEALLPILNIEDQAPKVKKAQRDLTDREALTVRKNFNKQEAKDLAQLIDNLKNSPTRIEIELNQVRAKHVELEKQLEDVKTDSDP